MKLRPFNKNTDLLQTAQLFLDVFNSEPWNDKWESLEQVKETLLSSIDSPKFFGLVAIHQDNIAGFIFGNVKVWYTGNHFFLEEMCIDNKLQRMGTGTKMIKELKNHLSEMGIKAITLMTSRDMFCYDFYLKNDFEVIEDIKLLTVEI